MPACPGRRACLFTDLLQADRYADADVLEFRMAVFGRAGVAGKSMPEPVNVQSFAVKGTASRRSDCSSVNSVLRVRYTVLPIIQAVPPGSYEEWFFD